MNVDYAKLCTGQALSNLGSAISVVAIPLLALSLTGSSLGLGVVSAANWLPYPLLGPVAGALVDRWDRKRSMIGCDVLRMALLGSVPALAAAGLLTFWWLCVVAFTASTLTILFNASQFAVLPRLVPPERLAAANGNLQAAIAVGTITGPLLAGALLTALPVSAMLGIDAASFAASAISVTAIGTSFQLTVPPADRDLAREVAQGLRYVAAHPVLRQIAVMMAVINFFGLTIYAQVAFFASGPLGYSRQGVGVLYAVGGAGVVICTALAGRLRSRLPVGALMFGVLVAWGVAIGLLALAPPGWPAAPIWAAVAGAPVVFNSCTAYVRQRLVPEGMLGRANAVAAVLAFTPAPLGVLVGGTLIAWTGMPRLVFGAIGLVVVLCAVAFSRTALAGVSLDRPAVHAGGSAL
jgi:predicted MFS family arabinose efflux permease